MIPMVYCLLYMEVKICGDLTFLLKHLWMEFTSNFTTDTRILLIDGVRGTKSVNFSPCKLFHHNMNIVFVESIDGSKM